MAPVDLGRIQSGAGGIRIYPGTHPLIRKQPPDPFLIGPAQEIQPPEIPLSLPTPAAQQMRPIRMRPSELSSSGPAKTFCGGPPRLQLWHRTPLKRSLILGNLEDAGAEDFGMTAPRSLWGDRHEKEPPLLDGGPFDLRHIRNVGLQPLQKPVPELLVGHLPAPKDQRQFHLVPAL